MAACLVLAPGSGRAQTDANDDSLELIVGLLQEQDREMRALAMQQVRDAVPGEAATKRFVDVLPDLAADAQAELLEALGERGDPAALPVTLTNLDDENERVRCAALRALGTLGGELEVPLLAEKCGSGTALERAVAVQSLERMRGDKIDAKLVETMQGAEAGVRAALLGVLAARNVKEAVPAVLDAARAGEPTVRLAALQALRRLADASRVPELIGLLESAKETEPRRLAELAILTVCNRGRDQCSDAIIQSLGDADPMSRASLLRCLARAGGDQALQTIVAHLDDSHEVVKDEAVRLLANWPDPAAVPYLKKLVGSENERYHVLAVRGLLRLARADENNSCLNLVAELWETARRVEEKKQVLGVLGTISDPRALNLALQAIDDPALTEEACAAAVAIAGGMSDGDQNVRRSALEQVVERTKLDMTRTLARKALADL